MPAWKVLLIGVWTCVCLALSMATILVTLDQEGAQRWLWMCGLLAATFAAGALLALFLRHAGGSLDTEPGWTRRR
jgi:hypothetical protein